jgi:hypothetical protein
LQSVKDTEKLKEAKERVYLKGFYEGVMLVGACAGMKVCDAKPIIKQDMLDKGQVHRPHACGTSRFHMEYVGTAVASFCVSLI